MDKLVLMLHTYNVYFIWVTFAIAGFWGLILYFGKRAMIKPWRISLIVAMVFGMLQAVFGIYMVARGLKPGGGVGNYYLHYMYGGLVALGIPLTWISFTSSSGENKRYDLLVYSIAALVIVALGVRAWMTGPA